MFLGVVDFLFFEGATSTFLAGATLADFGFEPGTCFVSLYSAISDDTNCKSSTVRGIGSRFKSIPAGSFICPISVYFLKYCCIKRSAAGGKRIIL